MLKIKIKNCCCCCNSSGGSSGGNSGGNSGEGTTTTKYTVTIGAPVDGDGNIIPNPTILVDGVEKQVGDTIEVDAGSTITVKVTADGYEDFEQEYTINESQTITPVLTATEPVYYSVTVNTTPSSATVTMNGTPGKVQSFLKGSNISIVASKSGYENRTAQVNDIQEDTVINLTLPEEPDPYDGYRLTPNGGTLNNRYTTNINITTAEAGHEYEENICSWIFNYGASATASTPGIASPVLPSDRTQVTGVGMSLSVDEGSELLDSYDLIHFTKFAETNNTSYNTLLADSSDTEFYGFNLGTNEDTNPEAYYKLKVKVKENITGTIKLTVTQATSGKKIIFTYTVN